MPVPIIVLDGSQPYGTDSVTVNSIVLVLDNIDVQRAVDIAEDRKATGAPNRWRSTAGFDTLTATAQYPTNGVLPKFGDYWDMTIDSNYGSEKWTLMPVNQTQTNDPTQLRKFPITARKTYNGVPTVVNA